MRVDQYRIGFLGFGHMAKALFRAIDHTKLIPRSQILFCQRDPERMKRSQEECGITATTISHLSEVSDLLFLCVRPSELGPVLAELKGGRPRCILSIAAGVKIAYLQRELGAVPVIRAMPNLPVEIGEGVTSLSYSPETSSDLRSLARLLFKSMGLVVELTEELIDCVIAIAGSAPAFLFALIDAAARFGEANGIPYAIARQMAAQTFAGSGQMALHAKEELDVLIRSIAVPNGTTEAGLRILREKELERGFQAVLEATAARAAEISRQFQ